MNILHISYNLRGEAGKNLLRHHAELLNGGVSSRMLIGEKTKGVPNETIQYLDGGNGGGTGSVGIWSGLRSKAEDLIGDHRFLNTRYLDFLESDWFRWADIIELRQIHAGASSPYLNLELINEISVRKPLVWRLSDMWAFTGYCAYSFDCDRWKTGCGRCPQLQRGGGRRMAELRASRWDASRLQHFRKRRKYGNSDIVVVSPSEWMDENVGQSFLRKNRREVIPIGVDANLYEKEKAACRAVLGIERDAFVLIASIPSRGNYRKALDLLREVLSRYRYASDSTIILTSSGKVDFDIPGFRVVQPGFIEGDEAMAELYCAADVLLFPSRMDNSSQVLVESGVSGLATVAFDVGGNREYTSDACREFLIQPYDTAAFARAVEILYEDCERLPLLASATRDEISKRFAIRNQTERFVSLYRELIDTDTAVARPRL